MRKLSLSCISGWASNLVQGYWCPEGLDTICPYCHRFTHLQLLHMHFDNYCKCIISNARCAGCRELSYVFVIYPSRSADAISDKCKEIYLYPAQPIVRESVLPKGVIDEHVLERAYESAINAYNVGLWDACATSCRKTLEGIIHVLNPKSKGTLFERLDKLFTEVNLSEPLLHVSESIRKGGNIAAHFDLEKETDREVATLMLDLLDYFLQYTFLLKEKAKELEQRLDELGKKEKAESD